MQSDIQYRHNHIGISPENKCDDSLDPRSSSPEGFRDSVVEGRLLMQQVRPGLRAPGNNTRESQMMIDDGSGEFEVVDSNVILKNESQNSENSRVLTFGVQHKQIL